MKVFWLNYQEFAAILIKLDYLVGSDALAEKINVDSNQVLRSV